MSKYALTLRNLRRALQSLDWSEIKMMCIHLEVPLQTLEDIERQHQAVKERGIYAMSEWMSLQKPSWYKIVTALRETQKITLADEIESEYCKRGETRALNSGSSKHGHLPSMALQNTTTQMCESIEMCQNIASLDRPFANELCLKIQAEAGQLHFIYMTIVTDTQICFTIKEKEKDFLCEFRIRLICAPHYVQFGHHQYLTTGRALIDREGVREIFVFLQKNKAFDDFLDYSLLEHLINRLGTSELQEKMRSYTGKVNLFEETTTIENWELALHKKVIIPEVWTGLMKGQDPHKQTLLNVRKIKTYVLNLEALNKCDIFRTRTNPECSAEQESCSHRSESTGECASDRSIKRRKKASASLLTQSKCMTANSTHIVPSVEQAHAGKQHSSTCTPSEAMVVVPAMDHAESHGGYSHVGGPSNCWTTIIKETADGPAQPLEHKEDPMATYSDSQVQATTSPDDHDIAMTRSFYPAPTDLYASTSIQETAINFTFDESVQQHINRFAVDVSSGDSFNQKITEHVHASDRIAIFSNLLPNTRYSARTIAEYDDEEKVESETVWFTTKDHVPPCDIEDTPDYPGSPSARVAWSFKGDTTNLSFFQVMTRANGETPTVQDVPANIFCTVVNGLKTLKNYEITVYRDGVEKKFSMELQLTDIQTLVNANQSKSGLAILCVSTGSPDSEDFIEDCSAMEKMKECFQTKLGFLTISMGQNASRSELDTLFTQIETLVLPRNFNKCLFYFFGHGNAKSVKLAGGDIKRTDIISKFQQIGLPESQVSKLFIFECCRTHDIPSAKVVQEQSSPYPNVEFEQMGTETQPASTNTLIINASDTNSKAYYNVSSGCGFLTQYLTELAPTMNESLCELLVEVRQKIREHEQTQMLVYEDRLLGKCNLLAESQGTARVVPTDVHACVGVMSTNIQFKFDKNVQKRIKRFAVELTSASEKDSQCICPVNGCAEVTNLAPNMTYKANVIAEYDDGMKVKSDTVQFTTPDRASLTDIEVTPPYPGSTSTTGAWTFRGDTTCFRVKARADVEKPTVRDGLSKGFLHDLPKLCLHPVVTRHSGSKLGYSSYGSVEKVTRGMCHTKKLLEHLHDTFHEARRAPREYFLVDIKAPNLKRDSERETINEGGRKTGTFLRGILKRRIRSSSPLSTLEKYLTAQDVKRFELTLNEISAKIRQLEDKRKGLLQRDQSSTQLNCYSKLAKIKSELADVSQKKTKNITQVRNIEEQVRRLGLEITSRKCEASRLLAGLRHKSAERIDDAVSELGQQLLTRHYSGTEKRKLQSEIDKLKGSKDSLREYQKAKDEIEKMISEQEQLRERRNSMYRMVRELRAKEGEARDSLTQHWKHISEVKEQKRELQFQKDTLTQELGLLYKKRQKLRDDFRSAQSDYITATSQRETEERERESQIRDLARTVWRRRALEPERRLCDVQYEKEKLTCRTLIAHLDKLSILPITDSNFAVGGVAPRMHFDPWRSNSSPTATTSLTREVKPGEFLPRKNDSLEDYLVPSSKRKSRREKKRHAPSGRAPRQMQYDPMVLSQFQSLSIHPPISHSQIEEVLQTLREKLVLYDNKTALSEAGDSGFSSQAPGDISEQDFDSQDEFDPTSPNQHPLTADPLPISLQADRNNTPTIAAVTAHSSPLPPHSTTLTCSLSDAAQGQGQRLQSID